ncbi:MAG: hypothetical protein H8E66_32690 [Planctomycetes bacterium]|nr:hypothetical protein [Planctomycetota bacterium]
MDSTKEHLEQQQTRPGGIAGDLQRVKTEGGAAAAELREFLSRLKGRSPQEVMGIAAESNLFRSVLTATAGCVVLLVILTVVPYAIKGAPASVSKKPKTAAAAQSTNEKQPVPAATEDQTTAATSEPDLERAAEAMGIGGAAEADPNSNPLDSKLDNLLDGVE